MKPDFSNISFAPNPKAFQNLAGSGSSPWTPAEGIPVKPVYDASDAQSLKHLRFAAGLPPYLRGPYASMYVQKPWTIRQYAGFSTAEES